MPSRPGIARSSVIASGRCSRQSASASSPSDAVPTTSTPAWVRADARTRRMKPESSATTTRCFCSGMEGASGVTGSVDLRGGEVGVGEDTLGAEEDDQAVLELRDALDGLGARGRDLVELLVLDGQDLLDLVDDDARGELAGLDDDDLALDVHLVAEAQTGSQVADRDDPPAQRDHSADPVGVGGDGARLRVADDLLDVRDGQRVLLLAKREDDELPHGGVVSHVGSFNLYSGKRPPAVPGGARCSPDHRRWDPLLELRTTPLVSVSSK